MAGHWIKWEKGLARKPEILQIAKATKADPLTTAARAMLIWEWADDMTRDGIISGVDHSDLDQIAQCKGFAKAMETTRPHPWLVVNREYIEFPNYDKHNGESAKKRLDDALRKRRERDRKTENE